MSLDTRAHTRSHMLRYLKDKGICLSSKYYSHKCMRNVCQAALALQGDLGRCAIQWKVTFFNWPKVLTGPDNAVSLGLTGMMT